MLRGRTDTKGIERTRLAVPTGTSVHDTGVYVTGGISVFISVCLNSWKIHFRVWKRKVAGIMRRCSYFRTRITGRWGKTLITNAVTLPVMPEESLTAL